MVGRVLVPVDESEMAEAALRYALTVHPDAAITVLHVVGEPSPMMGEAAGIALDEDPGESAAAHAEDALTRALEIAAEHGVEIETAVAVGSPAKVIVNRAEDFDVVVIGSHGGSLLERLFVGNVADRVVRDCPVSVTIVR